MNREKQQDREEREREQCRVERETEDSWTVNQVRDELRRLSLGCAALGFSAMLGHTLLRR